MLESFLTPEVLLSLLTLTALEVVLGIDNIIFISILASKLPVSERDKARKFGLMGALVSRLMLLSVIAYIVKLTAPLFSVAGLDFSGKSLILLIGGLFLIYKATREIHEKLEGDPEHLTKPSQAVSRLGGVVLQIMLIDIVFSLDSVITAVGMTPFLSVMVLANIIALAVMLLASKWIADFVQRHPTIKVLALSFLLMIGLVLVADGLSFHIPKGYVYFAMGFSIFVETINIRSARRRPAV
jgi:predicted tellurium resistance membrane protein TerC